MARPAPSSTDVSPTSRARTAFNQPDRGAGTCSTKEAVGSFSGCIHIAHITALLAHQRAEVLQTRAIGQCCFSAILRASSRFAARLPQHQHMAGNHQTMLAEIFRSAAPKGLNCFPGFPWRFPTASPKGWFISESKPTTLRPLSLPIATMISANWRGIIQIGHESALAQLDVQHNSMRASSDLLAHHRGSDQGHRRNRTSHISQCIHSTVCRRQVTASDRSAQSCRS